MNDLLRTLRESKSKESLDNTLICDKYDEMREFISRPKDHAYNEFIDFMIVHNYPVPKRIELHSSHMSMDWETTHHDIISIYVYKSRLVYKSTGISGIYSSVSAAGMIGIIGNRLDSFFNNELSKNHGS